MSEKARLGESGRQTVVDSDSGEVISEKRHRFIVEDDKQFFLTYCKVLGLLKDLALGEIKTLAWLTTNLPFNSNMQVVTSTVKEKIAAEMGISASAVTNSLPKLVKAGILYREPGQAKKRDAVYYIHPEYYWKGDYGERQRKLKYVLEIQRGENESGSNGTGGEQA